MFKNISQEMNKSKASKPVAPDDVLERFKCSVCSNYLSKAPIRQENDKYFCGRCPGPGNRSDLLEEFAKQFLYPCQFKVWGCTQFLEWNSVELNHHDVACNYKTVSCLVQGCDWSGKKSELMEHCESSHSDLVLDDNSYISLNLNIKKKYINLLKNKTEHFITKVETDGEVIRFSMNYFPGPSDLYEYTFDVKFFNGDDEWRYVNRKMMPYDGSEIYDSKELKVSVCTLHFGDTHIKVQFAPRKEKVNRTSTARDIVGPAYKDPIKRKTRDLPYVRKIHGHPRGHSVIEE